MGYNLSHVVSFRKINQTLITVTKLISAIKVYFSALRYEKKLKKNLASDIMFWFSQLTVFLTHDVVVPPKNNVHWASAE